MRVSESDSYALLLLLNQTGISDRSWFRGVCTVKDTDKGRGRDGADRSNRDRLLRVSQVTGTIWTGHDSCTANETISQINIK